MMVRLVLCVGTVVPSARSPLKVCSPLGWNLISCAYFKTHGSVGYGNTCFEMDGDVDCWRSLTPKINRQTLNKIHSNKSQIIVIGYISNQFHEFWCSKLFYRIYSKYVFFKMILNSTHTAWRK